MRYNTRGTFEGGEMRFPWFFLGLFITVLSAILWFVAGAYPNHTIPATIGASIATLVGFLYTLVASQGRSLYENDLDERTVYAKVSEAKYDGKHYAILANMGNGEVKFYRLSKPLPDSLYLRRCQPDQSGDYKFVPYA